MEAPILIPPNRQLEFHVHIYAPLLIIGVVFAYNSIGKYDQPMVYAFKLFNKA